MESKRKRKVSVQSDEEDEVSNKLPKTTAKMIDKKLGKKYVHVLNVNSVIFEVKIRVLNN